MDESELQREYYETTAAIYDSMHAAESSDLALAFLNASITALRIESMLEVGSGTGNLLLKLPTGIRAVGVEPVAALRERGYEKGVARDSLIDGDATQLGFADGSFDLVCAFAVLHHVRRPEVVISEMLRVASKAIFICDANNFGQGSRAQRGLKQFLNAAGLWRTANLIKTRGKGYTVTMGDGVSYSYSVFTNLRQIEAYCSPVHMMNLDGSGPNLYRCASSIALLALKA